MDINTIKSRPFKVGEEVFMEQVLDGKSTWSKQTVTRYVEPRVAYAAGVPYYLRKTTNPVEWDNPSATYGIRFIYHMDDPDAIARSEGKSFEIPAPVVKLPKTSAKPQVKQTIPFKSTQELNPSGWEKFKALCTELGAEQVYGGFTDQFSVIPGLRMDIDSNPQPAVKLKVRYAGVIENTDRMTPVQARSIAAELNRCADIAELYLRPRATAADPVLAPSELEDLSILDKSFAANDAGAQTIIIAMENAMGFAEKVAKELTPVQPATNLVAQGGLGTDAGWTPADLVIDLAPATVEQMNADIDAFLAEQGEPATADDAEHQVYADEHTEQEDPDDEWSDAVDTILAAIDLPTEGDNA